MRRFARILRRFADKLDPQPQKVYVDRDTTLWSTNTTATNTNVTFNWHRSL